MPEQINSDDTMFLAFTTQISQYIVYIAALTGNFIWYTCLTAHLRRYSHQPITWQQL